MYKRSPYGVQVFIAIWYIRKYYVNLITLFPARCKWFLYETIISEHKVLVLGTSVVRMCDKYNIPWSHCLDKASYLSAHALLNLFNELRRRDKMRGLPSILSLFHNKFNKFNNTIARMLNSIYYMTLGLLWNLISAGKSYYCVIMYATLNKSTLGTP